MLVSLHVMDPGGRGLLMVNIVLLRTKIMYILLHIVPVRLPWLSLEGIIGFRRMSFFEQISLTLTYLQNLENTTVDQMSFASRSRSADLPIYH